MKQRVYIETSLISYLTAKVSRDLVTAANQNLTQRWWEHRRVDFDLFVSQIVLDEAGAGDPQEAEKRMEAIDSIPVLILTPEAIGLAEEFLSQGALPPRAKIDALHIAIAIVNKMDYLLTWNCRHIANAEIQKVILRICHTRGYQPPATCTPQLLLGEWNYD